MKRIAGMKGSTGRKVVAVAAFISVGGLLFGSANAILVRGNADGWRIPGSEATWAVAHPEPAEDNQGGEQANGAGQRPIVLPTHEETPEGDANDQPGSGEFAIDFRRDGGNQAGDGDDRRGASPGGRFAFQGQPADASPPTFRFNPRRGGDGQNPPNLGLPSLIPANAPIEQALQEFSKNPGTENEKEDANDPLGHDQDGDHDPLHDPVGDGSGNGNPLLQTAADDGAGSDSANNVPEPGSFALLGIGLLSLLARRRRP